MLDVFISYRHADAEDVRRLVPALERAGLSVWFDEQRIEDFASIQASIETALARAKVLLAWYSQRYPESRACQWELTAALVAAQREGDVSRRILVVNPASTNAHIHPIQLRDAKYAAAPADGPAFDTLAKSVARHCATLQTPLGATGIRARPAWIGSASGFGSSRFVGRLRELWAIHSGLHAGSSPIITDHVARPLVWVTGMGGSGKSVLAEEYGLRFGAAYPGGVVWLSAFGHDDAQQDVTSEERAQDRERQLAAIAEVAGIAVKELSAAEVRTRLGQSLDEAGPYLWVVDDMPSDLSWDATQEWLAPSSKGFSLVSTRRRHENGQGVQVRVEELDEEEAYVLLTARRPPGPAAEVASARRITALLGLHPLGIELAAAAIQQTGYAEFEHQLERTEDDELEFAASLLTVAGTSLPHREGRNLYLSRTLLASTRGLSESGLDLLRLAAQVAAAPISRVMTAGTFAVADSLDEPQARRRADLAIVELTSRSLGRPAAAGGVDVHTLVSRVVRFHQDRPVRMRAIRGGALVALFRELAVLQDARPHPELTNDALHARRLVDACRATPDPEQSADQANLLGMIARFDAGLGRYADSARLGREALEISRRVRGDTHHMTVAIAASFGVALHLTGDLTGARHVLEEALGSARAAFGDESVVTLGVMDNLASLLLELGAVADAEGMMRQIVQARERSGDPLDARALRTLNNIALAQLSAGKFQEAEHLIREVANARQRMLGSDHPHTLMSLNTLAGALDSLGRVDEAIVLLEQVLEGQKRTLGDTHPETLQVRSNLASLLSRRRDFAKAAQLQQELSELYRTALGPDHPRLRSRPDSAETPLHPQ